MSKKRVVTLSAFILAVVAITIGLCFVFLGNKSIKEVPSDLHVEQIDGDFFLVADYNSKYDYQFKLETLVEGEFLTVSVVDSKENCLNLSNQNLSIVAGEKYRFSACYIASDGAKGKGSSSNTLEWRPSWQLESAKNLSFDENNALLSWQEVYLADVYEVKIVSFDGRQQTLTSQTSQIDLSALKEGVYSVTVIAKSNNQNLLSSVSQTTTIRLERTNEIVSVARDLSDNLTVLCSQNSDRFEIFVDGNLKATMKAQIVLQGQLYRATLQTDFLFDGIDFENSIVQIKACENGYVKESALVQII